MTDEELPLHSIYSPSGSKRWLSCPASIQMQKGIEPPSGDNFFAEEGTAAHELASEALDNEVSCESYLGKEFNGFTVDIEMAKQTQKYVTYVEGLVTWQSKLLVETRVSLEFLEPGIFGTADAIVFDHEDQLEVIDLKYGRGIVVEATDNTQLMMYALGVVQYLVDEGNMVKEDLEVKLTIVQPRAPHADGPIRSYYVTVAQLCEFGRLAQRAIMQSKEENPPFGPSEDNCRWCLANSICKPHAEYQIKAMQLEFEEFKKPKRAFGESLRDANSIDTNTISQILVHSKSIQNWLSSLADYATAQMSQGKRVPGWKLVYGRSIRRWEEPDRVLDILLEDGVEEERLFNRKMLTAPQMEKELRPDEWSQVEHLVVKPQGNITLAPEHDKRPSINPNEEAVKDWVDE